MPYLLYPPYLVHANVNLVCVEAELGQRVQVEDKDASNMVQLSNGPPVFLYI